MAWRTTRPASASNRPSTRTIPSNVEQNLEGAPPSTHLGVGLIRLAVHTGTPQVDRGPQLLKSHPTRLCQRVDDTDVAQKFKQTVDEVTAPDQVVQPNPRDLVGVIARPWRSGVEHDDIEVEDHKVPFGADPLDPAEATTAHAVEARLLGQLP